MPLHKNTIEKQEHLKHLLDNPKECYQLHRGQTLIGVYNIATHKIHLMPCIEEPVWLELDPDSGEYVRGWEIIHNRIGTLSAGKPISNELLQQCNESALPPRLLTAVGYSCMLCSPCGTRPHIVMLELMGELNNSHHYRGFAVTPPTSPEYAPTYSWNSISLNATFWLPAYKELDERYKSIIKTIISELDDRKRTLKNVGY